MKMRKIKDLYFKYQEIFLYLVAGILTTLVSIISYQIFRFFHIYYIDADALSGNAGSQLPCIQLASFAGYEMGDMAAWDFLTFCGISADEVYAQDTNIGYRGGAD